MPEHQTIECQESWHDEFLEWVCRFTNPSIQCAISQNPAYLIDMEYPDDCIMDFDMRLIDLFQELNRKPLFMRERIRQEYYRIKELLDGKVPTRMELFTHMEDEVYEYCMRHAKDNPFRRYLDFLHDLHELSKEEEELCSGLAREFLVTMEQTDMQKSYKMPIYFLVNSGKGFFAKKEGYAIALQEDLKDWMEHKALQRHMGDVLEYRTMEYYRRRYKGISTGSEEMEK